MNLPDFIWLWRIAAWSMGLSIAAYLLLAVTGTVLFSKHRNHHQKPQWLRPLHYIIGWVMVSLVLLLLVIGLVGTIGHYGNLGHSGHLIAGLSVVVLVSLSAGTSTQISPQKPWARAVHLGINLALLVGLAWVSYTGWQVVQKYL